MDVKEKLVDALRSANKKCKARKTCQECKQYGKGLNCVYLLMADELISCGVTVQEWISADKRMPTQEDAPTEYVFTAYKNQNCYDVGIALWDTVVAYPDLYDYWMALPLPQPPKGE